MDQMASKYNLIVCQAASIHAPIILSFVLSNRLKMEHPI